MPADLAAMAGTDRALFEGSPRREEVRDLLTEDRCLLGQVVRGSETTVVGFVALIPRHFFGRDFITLLMVAEAWRRQGVGTQLLSAATGRATSATVFTSTNASNRPMRELLRSENWAVSGKLEGLDEDDPEIVYFWPGSG